MSKTVTTLTGAAGEHFIAYKLSAMGYVVAMTRGGSPTIDLIIGDVSGNSVSIQVKTSRSAYRIRKRNADNSYWEWDVNAKARHISSETLFYAFVDLKQGEGEPDVFVVPSSHVAKWVGEGFSQAAEKPNRYFCRIFELGRSEYKDRWNYITARLKPTQNDEGMPDGSEEVGGTENGGIAAAD